MHSSQSKTKVFIAAAVAAFALSALVASAASAAVVPAKFSSSSIKFTTSGLTVKRNGTEAKTCTFYGTSPSGMTEADSFFVSNHGEGDVTLSCTSSILKLQTIMFGRVSYDTVANRYTLQVSEYNVVPLESPWGSYSYYQGTFGGTWVNGSGATSSTVTFTNQTLGYTTSGDQLTIEGQIKATTSTGALLTLSH